MESILRRNLNNKMEKNNTQRKKKPDFVRQGGKRYKKLTKKWRKPRGIHSKARHKFKGHEKRPSIGYRSSKSIRGLNRFNLNEVLIKKIADLNKIENKSQIGVLHSKLGIRKKTLILKKIKELNLPILNIKNIDDYLKKIEEKISKRKSDTKKKSEERKQKKEKAVKESETKKAKEKEEKESKKEEAKKAIEGLEKKAEPKIDEKQQKKVPQDQTGGLKRRVTAT